VLGAYEISSRSIPETVVDIRLILATSLKAYATTIIIIHNHIIHNHPLVKLIATEADIQITSEVKAFSKILDIQLLDHLIITPENYYSFTVNKITE
jgi:DNA repair protein RadC